MTERRPVKNVPDLFHVDDYLIYTGIDSLFTRIPLDGTRDFALNEIYV